MADPLGSMRARHRRSHRANQFRSVKKPCLPGCRGGHGRAPGAYNHQDERSRMERDGPRQAGSPTVGSSVQGGSDGRGAERGRVHFRAAPGNRGRADRGCRLPLRPRSGQRTGAGEPGAAGRQGVPHGVGGLADRRPVRRPARPSPVREAPSCTTTNRPWRMPLSEAR